MGHPFLTPQIIFRLFQLLADAALIVLEFRTWQIILPAMQSGANMEGRPARLLTWPRLVAIVALLTAIALAPHVVTLGRGQPQVQVEKIVTPRSPEKVPLPRSEANKRASLDQSVWAELEKEEEIFSQEFPSTPGGGPGLARGMWLRYAPIKFWMKTLASDDPVKIGKAIEVFEHAGDFRPEVYFDQQSNLRPVLSYLQQEAFEIHSTMWIAKHVISEQRIHLNSAFEMNDVTVDDVEKAQELKKRFAGDSDDTIILNDVLPVLETFVPRLTSPDPEVAKKARKTIDLFTYSIFTDKDSSWWESTLSDLGNSK